MFLKTALLFALATSLLYTAPAFAQDKPETMKEAVMQVDGITSRVVDGLWEKTDEFWHEGDYNRIVALCRVIVEADPSFNDAYSNSAWLLWSQGDTDAADRFLQQGLDRTREKGDLAFEFGSHLYNTKRYGQAEKYLKKGIGYGGVPVTCYTLLGHTLRLQKKYEESIAVWQTVVKKFPKFTAGPANLARVQALKRDGK